MYVKWKILNRLLKLVRGKNYKIFTKEYLTKCLSNLLLDIQSLAHELLAVSNTFNQIKLVITF